MHFEGFSPTVYDCPAGYATIGYGHMLHDGESFAQGISKKAAQLLLKKDVEKAEQSVLRLIHVSLSEGQFDALVSFTYNLGAGALQRSTLRRKVNRREYQAIPRELMRWVYTGGVQLRGLVSRRRAETELWVESS